MISQMAQMLNNQSIKGDRPDYQQLFGKCRSDRREQGVFQPKKDTTKFSAMCNSLPSFLHKSGCCHSTLSSQYDNEIFPYEIHFPTWEPNLVDCQLYLLNVKKCC